MIKKCEINNMAYILIQFCSVVYVYIGLKMAEINYLPICHITALRLELISSISSSLSV